MGLGLLLDPLACSLVGSLNFGGESFNFILDIVHILWVKVVGWVVDHFLLEFFPVRLVNFIEMRISAGIQPEFYRQVVAREFVFGGSFASKIEIPRDCQIDNGGTPPIKSSGSVWGDDFFVP
ncbi:hypothetical protein AVEN_217914-1 [Araneus ventricosus]|uniref:Uncharacterized protein n=1 Tax=Araneus ventricosus TaxID=182803 RepID=A0A4Y2U1X5_ARAVE|nr:hypothetical protein AVEN_217914-1 [Araneus ventricosus]